MSITHPIDMTALEQARLVREGAVSSEELVTQTLDRIRELDPAYRAFVAVFDRAIDVAISRLRRKLEDNGRNAQLIKTVRGGGYVLAATVERV